MQAIMETAFDALYLIGVILVGMKMATGGRGDRQYQLFGLMAILLGAGDAFHLMPRSYALFTTGLEANAVALGIGKFVTSITMTIFYVILYHIWRLRYEVEGRKNLTVFIYLLAIIRVALCLFPQNDWTSYHAPVSWGIYRNIPFAMIGLIMIYLFYQEAKKQGDHRFEHAWFAIVLSFALYIPVVLWSDTIPWIGVLMVPKTLAYVWIIVMGYGEFGHLGRASMRETGVSPTYHNA